MAWAAVALVGAYLLAAVFVVAVDPYDIYPWGMPTEQPATDTPDNSMLVIEAAAKRPHIDVVMIGSSVSKTYTPEQILRLAPGARQAWNTSYPAVRPADRALTIETFMHHSRPRRLILWFDAIYIYTAETKQERFPAYLYDETHLNDLRMVDQNGLAAAWSRMQGGGAFRQGESLERKVPALDAANYLSFQNSKSMQGVANLVRRGRLQVAAPWRVSCDHYTSINEQLMPELIALSRQRVHVDLVFPAYSVAAYYQTAFRGNGPSLPDTLNMRRCIVAATARLANVTVWATDADTATIKDLANYLNPTHLYGDAVLMRVLMRIGDPAFRIDASNVDAYLARLRTAVVGYDVENSRLGIRLRHDP